MTGVEQEREVESTGYQVPFFTVNLHDGKPFDADVFDSIAEKITKRHNTVYLKFVIAEDNMYVFEAVTDSGRFEATSHLAISKALSISEKLQCTGKIEVDLEAVRLNLPLKITLSIGSDTLVKAGLLTLSDCKVYSDKFLKPALGDSFRI